jgi:hypothetical protein
MAPSLRHVVRAPCASSAGTVDDVATKPRKRRRAAVAVVAVLLIGAGAYAVVSSIKPLLSPPGCQAGRGSAAVSLDPQQAAIAATIAGVAYQRLMPGRAVTVAYAAAMQESKMHNLGYGDRDSVGIFQQRPSEGWGPARKLRDPVYATARFFQALAGVHGYQRMPVYQAAQAVQRSADGYAYVQYQPMAVKLTAAFTGKSPHAVWCWASGAPHGTANLTAARSGLWQAFGSLSAERRSIPHDAPSLRVPASHPGLGWEVACWLVTHAARYHLHSVRYDGLQWRASAGTAGWTRDKSTAWRNGVSAS